MSGEPTVIYRAASPQQAHLLKSVLENRGIAAWVVNEAMQIAGGDLPLGWTAAAQVVVGENDAEEARQIAVEFDQTTAHEPQSDEDVADIQSPQAWQDWPICSQCQERRQARCPVCGSAGTAFPLADIEQHGGQSRVLLICATCDDHFRPEFYRVCHRCGHDYGDGIEKAGAVLPADDTRRVWLLMGVLVAAGLAMAAYFTWVMQ